MRIAELDIAAFGCLTDCKLDFGAKAECDLHVLYGPNEAGKSTIRKAVVDMLYGIDPRTTYDFIHDKQDLRVGGLIQHADRVLHFFRVKKRKSLLDEDGNELADDALAPFLGSVTQEHFLRMFALDHDALVRGGEEMRDPSSSLGQLLFQSAAGLTALRNVLSDIDDEADAIWGPRQKESRLITQVQKRFNLAREQIKTSMVTSPQWGALDRERRRTEEEESQAKQTEAEARAKVSRIERIKRVSPLLSRRKVVEIDTARYAGIVRLPPNAARRAYEARHAMSSASERKDEAERALGELREQLKGLPKRADILEDAAEIDRLCAENSEVGAARRQLPQVLAAAETARNGAMTAARSVGVTRLVLNTHEDIHAATAELPTTAVLDAIASQIDELVAAAERLSSAEEQLRQANDGVDAEEAALRNLVRPSTNVRLAAALRTATRFRDQTAARETPRRARDAQGEAAQELAKLSWPVSIDALRTIRPPPVDEFLACATTLERLSERMESLKQQVTDAEAQKVEADAQIEGLRDTSGAATTADVEGARQARDDEWRAIQEDPRSLPVGAAKLTEAIVRADGVADRRFNAAESAARLGLLIENASGKSALARRLTEMLGETQESAKEQLARQGERCGTAGMPDLLPRQAIEWLEGRQRALHAADLATRLFAEAEAERTEADSLVNAIVVALGAAAPGERELEICIAAAESAVERDRRTLAEYERIDERCKVARKRQRQAESDVESRRTRRAGAKRTVESSLASIGAGVADDISEARNLVAGMRELTQTVHRLSELARERIDPMERLIQSHSEAVNRLIDRYIPEQTSDAEIGLNRVRDMARKASEVERARTHLQEAMAERQASAASANQAIEGAKADVADLFRACGAADAAALVEAAERSDAARAADKALDDITQAILDAGEGQHLEHLVAEDESIPIDRRDADLDAAKRALEEASKAREQKQEQRFAAVNAFMGVGASDMAASAEAMRQGAICDMTNGAERYVEARTAVLLLRTALERYRERQQGPLLMRASEYFEGLTGGEHVRLTVPDPDKPKLASRTRQGRTVAVDELSEGTRDQVYLALRLSALERAMEQGHPMPFIADDLLINYDDSRAAAGFRALSELARKTQVLYFTHHQHLVEIARRATQGRAAVIQLLMEPS